MNNYHFNEITSIPTQSMLEIPKIFHFVWLGDKSPPREYNDYIYSWGVNYPEFKLMLWHDKNIPSELVTGNLLEEENRVVCRADILRYEILYKYGGIYIDMDFLPVNKMPKSMLYGCFFACESPCYISIGIIGSYAGNELFFKILKMANENIKHLSINEQDISKLSGPKFLTEMYFKNKELFKDVILYSPHHFYKYTFQEHHSGKKYDFETYKRDKSIFGIHMWGNSWGQTNKSLTVRHGYLPVSFMFSNTPRSIYPYMIDDDSLTKPYELCIDRPEKSIVICSTDIYSGGIERFISLLVNDGSFMPSYTIYVLANNIIKYTYTFENARCKLLLYDNIEIANRIINDINPEIIIDNSWIYKSASDVNKKYEGINMEKIIFIMHTSTKYNSTDIRDYNIKNIIHLYKEENMHESFREIAYSKIIPNGIHEMSNLSHELKISVIGRISWDKIDTEAIYILNQNNITLNFYGDNCDKTLLEALKNCNIFPFTEINSILNQTDVILFMCQETCSYTCLEAMSHRKYIVAKRCSGMESLLKEYTRGFLFDSNYEICEIIKKIHSLSGIISPDMKRLYSFDTQKNEIEKYIHEIIHRCKMTE